MKHTNTYILLLGGCTIAYVQIPQGFIGPASASDVSCLLYTSVTSLCALLSVRWSADWSDGWSVCHNFVSTSLYCEPFFARKKVAQQPMVVSCSIINRGMGKKIKNKKNFMSACQPPRKLVVLYSLPEYFLVFNTD